MKIVVTRERGTNEQLKSWLPPGSDVVEVPLTKTHFDAPDEVGQRITESGRTPFGSLVVTSERTKNYLPIAQPFLSSNVGVFSVGSSTTRALEASGLTVRAQSLGSALDLDRQIDAGPVLMLGAVAMREELPTALRRRGLDVVHVSCYETRGVDLSEDDENELRDADVVIIGAPSAWQKARPFITPTTLVIVPGASTAAVVKQEHHTVVEGWGPRLAELLK